MAKLTAAVRNNLPTSDFALPKDRAYPINDRGHAANALARVSHNGTAEEKAAFIQAAFAELQRQLGYYTGQLEEASYVIVREVAASDWGYGGQTQLARRNTRGVSALPWPAGR